MICDANDNRINNFRNKQHEKYLKAQVQKQVKRCMFYLIQGTKENTRTRTT